jgi:hypothetical protein
MLSSASTVLISNCLIAPLVSVIPHTSLSTWTPSLIMTKRRVSSKIPPHWSLDLISQIFAPSKNTSCKRLRNFLAPKATSTVGWASRWTPPHTFFWKARLSPSHPILVRRQFFPVGRALPKRHENDPSNVCPLQKLLLFLQEHHAGVLLHAQCQCIGSVQSVKQPHIDGVEINNVHH